MNSGRMIFGSGNLLFPVVGGARSVPDDVAGGKRRPCFTVGDEYFEDEYYDEQLPEKKRRLTQEQVHLLERSFELENKLEPERKSELSRKLGLQPRQVAVWFQNRRARWKTKQLENDFGHLKASYDALRADHDSLLNENDGLRSQIVSLTEKLLANYQTVSGVTDTKQTDQDGSSAEITALNYQVKSEDRVSSGSGGSAIVDGNGRVESVFLKDNDCVGPPVHGGVHSEEDDVSDEGCSYSAETVFAEQLRTDEDAELGWWVWS